jgi:hypothetical protein
MADEDHDSDPDDVLDPDDALAEGMATATLPFALTLPALGLVAAIALPLHPDGYSFVQLLYVVAQHSLFQALIMLLGYGAPFCFGAIVLILAGLGPRVPADVGLRALVLNLSLLHAQLLLVAAMLWSRGEGVMPLAFLGFALVSGGYLIVQRARASATDADAAATQRALVRWGATMIVAICGWIRLQMLIGVKLGWAIEVMLAAGVMMTVLLMRRAEMGRAGRPT